jgi:hypothetical protein
VRVIGVLLTMAKSSYLPNALLSAIMQGLYFFRIFTSCYQMSLFSLSELNKLSLFPWQTLYNTHISLRGNDFQWLSDNVPRPFSALGFHLSQRNLEIDYFQMCK